MTSQLSDGVLVFVYNKEVLNEVFNLISTCNLTYKILVRVKQKDNKIEIENFLLRNFLRCKENNNTFIYYTGFPCNKVYGIGILIEKSYYHIKTNIIKTYPSVCQPILTCIVIEDT